MSKQDDYCDGLDEIEPDENNIFIYDDEVDEKGNPKELEFSR